MTERISRRSFIETTTSCAAHLAFIPAAVQPWARRFIARDRQRKVVAEEPWGRLEEIGEGLWALISTPLEGERLTLCNGGIVAGADGVMVVESFASSGGATWMAEQARMLTGRWPSHVVLTHFHGDHTGGIQGFSSAGSPGIHATAVTRDLTLESERGREEVSEARLSLLTDVVVIPVTPTTIDLGGRSVRILPREGHTPSDVTIELDDPSVVYCGDLVWNRMFPNYRDAIPSLLSRDVRALRRNHVTTYVPGHGPLADGADLDRFIQVIDSVEDAARRAHERGVSAAEAAKTYSVPPSLGEWVMFSERYYEVALRAWERELGA